MRSRIFVQFWGPTLNVQGRGWLSKPMRPTLSVVRLNQSQSIDVNSKHHCQLFSTSLASILFYIFRLFIIKIINGYFDCV